jgi:hypothetical protein
MVVGAAPKRERSERRDGYARLFGDEDDEGYVSWKTV